MPLTILEGGVGGEAAELLEDKEAVVCIDDGFELWYEDV